MTQDVTAVEFFAGAGGTTTGVVRAGVRMLMAANHWPIAVETHNMNHPSIDHFLGDISDTDMDRFPKADILFASPECRTHSSAYGKKRRKPGLFDDSPPSTDAEERSRATMWDVCRYAERHAPAMAIVENVVEIIAWEFHGELYDQWIGRMRAAGYEHREVFVNSMVAWPTPQSRDRIYIVFWKHGHPAPNLDITPWCWCARCATPVQAVQSWKNPLRPRGKYRTQYVYRCPRCAEQAFPYAYAAATAIDWSLPAPRIGERARALAPATIARIRAGLERYGPTFLAAAAGNTWERRPGVRTWPVDGPIPTQATTAQHALVVDVAFGTRDRGLLVDVQRQENNRSRVRSTEEPVSAQTGRATKALIVPMGSEGAVAFPDAHPLRTAVAECSTQALLVPVGGTWNTEARPVDGPMRVRTARETEGLLVPLRNHGRAEDAELAPMPTVAAAGNHHGFVLVNRTHNRPRSVDEPLAPMMTGEHQALILRNYSGGAEMTKPASEPTGTVTARDHHSLLVPYYGTGRAYPVGDPMHTLRANDSQALVVTDEDIDDCGFRMLEPEEIKRAMAFPDDYKVVGTRRDQVRQWGNALTPPVADLLTQRALETFG